MARLSYPKSDEPLPAPLPPETRTVGQLVAETLKLYGEHFLRALGIGVPIAALGLVTTTVSGTVVYVVAPLLTGVLGSTAYVYAVALAHGTRDRQRLRTAWVAGFLVFVPVTFLVIGFILPALAWIAAVGLAVPAIAVEGLGLRAGFARGWKLARADYAHALGGLATLAILVFVCQLFLVFLLHGAADQAIEGAFVMANIVLSPLLFLGLSLLYVDQRARVQ
jgi:hypothetical protein